MKKHFIPALKITVITAVIFGVIYPLIITGIAKISAPNGGEGKTIVQNEKVVGFELIGQLFESDKYFQGRPSAVGYNAAATGGSNKGPTNPDYLAQVQARIDSFLVHNPGIQKSQIPVDLVTASGGGLDPHISIQAAMVQIPRIARVREISELTLKSLVLESVDKPLWNMFGPEGVNVLKLNIALDQLK